jgi:hypothetical protein
VDPVEARLVAPYYLSMMGSNALDVGAAAWAPMVTAGRSATAEEVVGLLASENWRPVVMGAWFSLRHDASEVAPCLVEAVGRSQGWLTAPPLAVAAALVVGPAAGQALTAYVSRFAGSGEESTGFVAAAAAALGSASLRRASRSDRAAYTQLLEVAERLRTALRGAP